MATSTDRSVVRSSGRELYMCCITLKPMMGFLSKSALGEMLLTFGEEHTLFCQLATLYWNGAESDSPSFPNISKIIR